MPALRVVPSPAGQDDIRQASADVWSWTLLLAYCEKPDAPTMVREAAAAIRQQLAHPSSQVDT